MSKTDYRLLLYKKLQTAWGSGLGLNLTENLSDDGFSQAVSVQNWNVSTSIFEATWSFQSQSFCYHNWDNWEPKRKFFFDKIKYVKPIHSTPMIFFSTATKTLSTVSLLNCKTECANI